MRKYILELDSQERQSLIKMCKDLIKYEHENHLFKRSVFNDLVVFNGMLEALKSQPEPLINKT